MQGQTRQRRYWIATLSICLAMIASMPAAAADPEIVPVEQWSNVFAGEEISQNFLLPRGIGAGQAVGWSVVVETAVIARRETAARVDADGRPVLTVQFRLPDGEPRTVLPVSIVVVLGNREVVAKQLWIYPRNPFDEPVPNLDPTGLVLFDPHRETADRWDDLPLKFRFEKNVDALTKVDSGVVVIGEGVSFREYRGLPRISGALARRGVKVLCLAPEVGSIALSDKEASGQQGVPAAAGLNRLILRQSDVLKDFDKRLDHADWRGERSPVGTWLQMISKAGSISVDVSQDEGGWSWLEAEYSSGGRIIVSGFHSIEHWDAGPAARHALWHALAHTARDADGNVSRRP
jgi:hypothetical protein